MRRRLAVLFALLFILSPVSWPGLHAAPSFTALAASETAGTGTSGGQSREIVSLRTRTSRTYAQDGHYMAQLYPGSINYQDASGAWQPIDNTLVPATLPGYAYQNRANRYTVSFDLDMIRRRCASDGASH